MLKNVAIVGAGPAGLYLAYLLKVRRLANSVEVYEQNARNATYGFGVSLADSGLQRLRDFDPPSYERLTRCMHVLQRQTIEHPRGNVIVRDSRNAGAISRAQLLEVLGQCCEQVGVKVRHEVEIHSTADFAGHDLLVGADGTNSVVRTALAAEFGTSTYFLNNRFAWFGTKCPFEGSTLTFLSGEGGTWCGHHYRYSESMSTFVPECDSKTWEQTGLDRMNDAERRTFVENLFGHTLRGYELISNNSIWRRFRVTRNERCTYRNVVLIGDALFTAHYSIGSGTRLAMEDSIALVQCLQETPDNVEHALAGFEERRKPQRARYEHACEKSWNWYERVSEKIGLTPIEFAYDYMTRTGRMDEAKLRAACPEFMKQVDEFRALGSPARVDAAKLREPS
jgi:2-polyprenyl-6-methoxyphenol hydroxylase-like FAD-dependent oxidoreductase